MLIICEGIDKCGKSTFIKNLGIPIYEANDEWGAGITKPLDYNKFKSMKTIDYFYNFRHQLHDKNIGLHLTSDDEHVLETATKYLEISKVCNLYLDRSWISELCYGPVYRNKSRLNSIDEKIILKELKNIPHQILWFDCDINVTYLRRLNPYNEFECNINKITKVDYNYKKIMNNYAQNNINIMRIEMIKGV